MDTTRKQPKQAPIPRLALGVGEAAASLGLSEDHFAEHVAPHLCWVRLGRKKVVAVTELQRWLDANGVKAHG